MHSFERNIIIQHPLTFVKNKCSKMICKKSRTSEDSFLPDEGVALSGVALLPASQGHGKVIFAPTAGIQLLCFITPSLVSSLPADFLSLNEEKFSKS